MGKQQINQFLRQRRNKFRKVARYRKKRIYKNFQKHKEQNLKQINEKAQQNQINRRKTKFYDQHFKNPQIIKQKVQKKEQINPQRILVNESQQRVQRLKGKKKKYIKKMQRQKTNKGQPKLKNYVTYALTKLEQTFEKEKLDKRKNKLEKKKQ